MKQCIKCGSDKPLSDFYKHGQMADGHLNKCKLCAKSDVRKNYRDNIDHYKAYERSRASLQHRVEARKLYSLTNEGKETGIRASLKWKKRNPIKRMANNIVNNAVRDGRIKKSSVCECCGSSPKVIHGHHDDYAFALVVRWLCPGCHSNWHKVNGKGLNAE